MESKKVIMIFMVIGGIAGGYVPLLWGSSSFSFATVICNSLGALLGIWIGFRLTH